jgi:hypothetical protein
LDTTTHSSCSKTGAIPINFNAYPMEVIDFNGALYENANPLFCGGKLSSGMPSDVCFELLPSTLEVINTNLF